MNPADLPRDEKGRYYHIACKEGDIAPYVLMCADPRRAERIAKRLDSPERKGDKRGYLTFTGTYNSVLLTIMGTGIGAPATAIAIVEAANCQKNATFIRVGTCGALQRHVALGDLVITKRVVREENTSENYGPPGIEVSGHPDVLDALRDAATEICAPFYEGVTCTTSDFFAGQGRIVPGFRTVDTERVERLARAGVLNLEMEMSVVYSLAYFSEYDLRAGGITTVIGNRITGNWATARQIEAFETVSIDVALRAVEILFKRD